MSLNVVLTSDKCNFQNHFSDPMVLPKNASVALSKAGMSIPVFTQNVLRVPQLDAVGRARTCLRTTIDGINLGITWTELFTAYSQYTLLNAFEPSLNADRFFSGEYEIWTNNFTHFRSSPAGVSDGNKPALPWVIAKAMSNKYEFYTVTDSSEYVDADITLGINSVGSANNTVIRPAVGAVPLATYNDVQLTCSKRINTSLNISYDPSAVTTRALTDATFTDADDCVNFVSATKNLTSTAVVGEAAMAYGNEMNIDLNGGYMMFTPNLADTTSTMACGFSLVGNPKLGNDNIPVNTYSPELIDIGIEVGFDARTNSRVLRMIDGQTKNNVYTGAVAEQSANPNFRPALRTLDITNDSDEIAILCKRGNIINGSYEYVFTVLLGDAGNPIEQMVELYQSRITLNTSGIRLAPIFMSSVNSNSNQFRDIEFITRVAGGDTDRQGENFLTRNYSTADIVSIQPVLEGRSAEETNFWSAIGLHSYYQDQTLVNANSNRIEVSYDGTPLNKVIKWKTDFKDQDSTNTNVSYYWVGKRNINDFYFFDTASETWRVNVNNGLAFLPKYLNVYVLNLTVKNYSGSYSSLGGQSTNTGENRLVGTIPLSLGNITQSQDVEVQYETFNPYYRPVNNPDNYPLNEFIMEVSYKDFLTDQRKTIDNITGILKLELNIRRGADINVNKVMGQQGILPFI